MDKKYIYITRKIPDEGIKMLKDKGYEVDIGKSLETPSKNDIIEALKQKPYSVIICFLTDKMDTEIFDACPTLKLVASFSVGFDHIDLPEAKKRGIFVSNTQNTSSNAVAETAIGLMFALTTRLVEGDRLVREGKYDGWSPYRLIGTDIKDKVIGLVGLGAIGREVAKKMHGGFYSKILYNDLKQNEEFEKETGATFVDQETVFKESDIVSIHVPLMDATHHLVNEKTLKMMKKTAYLINTSRGPVVDEKALVAALESGTIAGAGLDVYEFEPKITEGLLKLQNVVLTPHIASARESVRKAMAECVARSIITFYENGAPECALKT